MTNQDYLLTYTDCGSDKFAWFNTKEEMIEFIENERVSVIEAWHIEAAKQVEIG